MMVDVAEWMADLESIESHHFHFAGGGEDGRCCDERKCHKTFKKFPEN